MGVKGLSTPIIRDSATAKNANIKKLLEKDATKRLCFELNDQGKCVRVLNHPAATCACPVGCIWCAHKGSLLVLCHAIISYSTRWLDDNGNRPSFESIVSQFPRPVNELVSTPIPVDAIYPEPTSVDKKAQNEWKRMTFEKEEEERS